MSSPDLTVTELERVKKAVPNAPLDDCVPIPAKGNQATADRVRYQLRCTEY